MTHVNPLFNLIETGFFCLMSIDKLRFVGYSDTKRNIASMS